MSIAPASLSMDPSNVHHDMNTPGGELETRLQKMISAQNHHGAVEHLIFAVSHAELVKEREVLYRFILTLLPKLDPDQFNQLCERLPRLLEGSADLPQTQAKLALGLALRVLQLVEKVELEKRLDYYISGQFYCSYARKMAEDCKDYALISESHLCSGKIFSDFALRYLIEGKNYEENLDRARRSGDGALLDKYIEQIEQLKRFCFDIKDREIVQVLYQKAILVANRKNDILQKHFAPVYLRIDGAFPISTLYPSHRYQQKLLELRKSIISLESISPISDFQNTIFRRYSVFIGDLVSDILVILGPPPCHFDLRAMGSIGRREICPFSDLEFMILLERPDEKVIQFFNYFLFIFELQFACLGETPDALPLKFTALRLKAMKGFYIDLSPRKERRLLTTPKAMAALQSEKSLEGPTSIQHTALRSSSLYTTDESLYKAYQDELEKVVNSHEKNRLVEMGEENLDERKKSYSQLWPQHFLKGMQSRNLKRHFIEPIFHLIGDLALIHGVKVTNTLDILEELGNHFNSSSRSLLKESIEFLFSMRIKVQNLYGQQSEEMNFTQDGHLSVFIPSEKELFEFEKIYWLVIFPLYSIEDLSKEPSIDLFSTAVSKAFILLNNEHEKIAVIRHLAIQLEKQNESAERHQLFYKKIGEMPNSEGIRRAYFEGLLDPQIQTSLIDIPTRTGLRYRRYDCEKNFFVQLKKMTTAQSPTGNLQVEVISPELGSLRFLKEEAARKILDRGGKIAPNYKSRHFVSRLDLEGLSLHFKMEPSHPLIEWALFDLYFRVCGQLSPPSLLVRFNVTAEGKTFNYPVVVSETMPFENLSEKIGTGENFSNFDRKQWSWLILCSILLSVGDGHLSNYLIDSKGRIFCVDNDLAFVKPIDSGWISTKVNFACALFFLSKNDHILSSEVLKEFAELDFDLILHGWMEAVIEKEKQYNGLFGDENKTVMRDVFVMEPPGEKDEFSSSILFAPGALVALRLQARKLQMRIKASMDRGGSLSCFDLLKEMVLLRPDVPINSSIGERVCRAYSTAARSKGSVQDRFSLAIGKKQASSLTFLEFQKASHGAVPKKEDIQRGYHSPRQAFQELLATFEPTGQREESYRTTQSKESVIEGAYVHISTDLKRQELVLNSLIIRANDIKKPTVVILKDCKVLDLSKLTSFLSDQLKILDIRGCPSVNGKWIRKIHQLAPNIEEISISNSEEKVWSSSTISLFSNMSFRRLKILSISGCPKFGSFKIDAPSLEVLDLSSNSHLESVAVSASCFPLVRLVDCPRLNQFGFTSFEASIKTDIALDRAFRTYKFIYEFATKQRGRSLRDLHVICLNYGFICEKQQRVEQAFQLYEQALEEAKRSEHEISDGDILVILNNLINISKKTGDPVKQKKYEAEAGKLKRQQQYQSLYANPNEGQD